MKTIPILTYHSLDETDSVISVRPGQFAQHMRLLSDRGFTGISLERAIEGWQGRVKLPPRPVVLTFDDGFRNVLEHGAPVIAERGFGATMFVVPQWMGATNDWPGQGDEAPRLPLLDLQGLLDLRAAGFEIGGHSLSHPRLSQLAAAEADSEIAGCRARLEDELGAPVRTFAYPYGDLSAAVVEQVRAHYEAACTVEMGTARLGDDRMRLPRLDVYYLREPATFGLLGTMRGQFYLRLRAAGRSVRGRLGS